MDLTAEQKNLLRELFSAPLSICPHCGGAHLRACPRVARLRWEGQGAGTGNLIEAEYWRDWNDKDVLWPEDAWDDEEENNGPPPGPVRTAGHGRDDEDAARGLPDRDEERVS